jgi:low affinity Fe/Cu permease
LQFQKLADQAARFAGSAWVTSAAFALIVGWGALGPHFNFSDSWSLFINTATTIITFLMVFLIQNSQNRGNAALQAKVDELIRVGKARNDLIGLEAKTEEEIEAAMTDIREKIKPR